MSTSDARPAHAPRDFLVRAADRRAGEVSFCHPLNPLSEVHGFLLGRHTGLRRAGVSLLRVPPGKESFVHHVHHVDEEWMFVLSGRGELRIGDERFDVGPGDFAGFPPRTLPHHLRNVGGEDLVYLCGGEALDWGVADFPDLGKRLVHLGDEVTVYPLEAGEPLLGGR